MDNVTTRAGVAPARFAELIADGGELIDVRRQYEYEGGRIPEARNIEMNELAAAADSLPRDRSLLFYCRRGNRSGMAAEAFRQAGFDAYHLEGGIEGWVDARNPLEPDGGEVRAPLPAS